GFGKGGKTLAVFLAKQAQSVAMIEKSKHMYGGTCINIACIPSKSLEYYAKQSKNQHFKNYEEQNQFYQNSIKQKNSLTSKLRAKNYENLNVHKTIKIFNGIASFLSSTEIKIRTDENGQINETIIQGDKIFINTGTLPNIPKNISNIKQNKYIYTSTTLMELKSLPKTLIIIGGGYIGLEFASIYTNFGSKVTIFESGSIFLSHEDEDISKVVYDTLTKRGIHIIMNVKIENINLNKIIYRCESTENKTQEADAILVAIGRHANIDELNLDKIGIKITKNNFIQVNEKLETTTKNIWAIGDVNGGPQFTYISLDDYRIIRDQLLTNNKQQTTNSNNNNNNNTLTTRKYIPYSIYIDPELSRIGLTEKEAIKAGYELKIFKKLTLTIPRAHQIEELDGLVKIIVDSKTNLIIGASLYCSYSSEVINIIRLAMLTNQSYIFLRDFIYTHPSMSEMFNDLLSESL
ncbi:unnamed protein product, partial [Didymodactylos carnosus]